MIASIWVGTDRWQKAAGAEAVLEYSIRKHATIPVDIHWMRSGDPGFEVGPVGSETVWNCGHDGKQAWPKQGWGTPFTMFRMAVPELAGFTGTHIYLDADMLVLADIKELLEIPRHNAWLSNSDVYTDVSVIDASAFENREWWPSIATMRKSKNPMWVYRNLIAAHHLFDPTLPWTWNMRDTLIPDGKLLHFTRVPSQPWKPYDTVHYERHANQACVDLWLQYQQEAKCSTR